VRKVEEQKFYDEVDQNKKEQDEILQEILKGVTELHEIAVGIGVGLDTGKELIKEVDKKMDKTIAHFKKSNARLQELLDESGGLSRWCPILICLIVLVALGGYIFTSVR